MFPRTCQSPERGLEKAVLAIRRQGAHFRRGIYRPSVRAAFVAERMLAACTAFIARKAHLTVGMWRPVDPLSAPRDAGDAAACPL